MRKIRTLTALVVAATAFSIIGIGVASATEIDPATGEVVVTDEDVTEDNGVVFCGFAPGDISDEELAEMGIDDTWTIEYKTQEECDAETAAAEADAAANPDPEGPDPTLTEPTEPTEEPVTEDEVIYPEPTEEAPVEVTEIIDASVEYYTAEERASFFGADLF